MCWSFNELKRGSWRRCCIICGAAQLSKHGWHLTLPCDTETLVEFWHVVCRGLSQHHFQSLQYKVNISITVWLPIQIIANSARQLRRSTDSADADMVALGPNCHVSSSFSYPSSSAGGAWPWYEFLQFLTEQIKLKWQTKDQMFPERHKGKCC